MQSCRIITRTHKRNVPSTPTLSPRRNIRSVAAVSNANGNTSSANAAPAASSSSAQQSNMLLELLQNVANGVLSAEDAAVQLNQVSSNINAVTEDLAASRDGAFAKADFPEVVWGEGKTPQQIATSLQRIAQAQGMAAATRVNAATYAAVKQILPDAQYSDIAQVLTWRQKDVKQSKLPGTVALITAGTASPGVVEECRLMLQACGVYSFKLPESGVMGMHRIVQNLEAVRAADVVVCVTGMDGGIVSVVAGMVDCPVIALPTSTGYGTAFGGVAPLLAALNSSAPGVMTVNIDSGFGAAMAAWRTLKTAEKAAQRVMPGP